MPSSFRVAGLFAGIGGIERGFHEALGDALDTVLLCENWEPAKRVLAHHFAGVDLHPDVQTLRDLPANLDLLAAGFPCTDLSQAGRTAGIRGAQSGLVSHVFEMLQVLKKQQQRMPWVLIENVPNMLTLDRGEAMAYLVGELGALGYRWAYRVVDSRFTGVPQRRRRVVLLASCTDDPRSVLFADEQSDISETNLRDDAFGFYWTEGRSGVGWAQDATPTLKGGSSLGIPSPPAIWLPGDSDQPRFVVPTVEDAEALQGFDRGWTAPAVDDDRRNGPRWKLVGNAVTVGVAKWVAERIHNPGDFDESRFTQNTAKRRWSSAGWGEGDQAWSVKISEFPRQETYKHLLDEIDVDMCTPLSHRAASGFWSRLQTTNLGRHPGFRDDMAAYVELTRTKAQPVPA
ncbi:DNA cytosine methyltransferase [Lentzea aerocolonigenes]|uniref:DNA cytosine methyltransferase n=1 Tax=Lentzea aerocolonigenes TaxID=68170 RepID=UPI0005652B22|nr:DNA cytosine methyltransferase [Lentzea aerocolonigenes]MCP2247677.1 DNA (cytosine-5)-methyltransferase 1 [Lentzea aerocolonigenes]